LGREGSGQGGPVRGSPVATRDTPLLKEIYERLLSAGRSKKAALVACIRELLPILNAVIRNHAIWSVLVF
jgi:transposase